MSSRPVWQDILTKWSENPAIFLAVFPLVVVVTYVASYLNDPYGLRAYPGPVLAKFSHAWLGWMIGTNRWSTSVQSLHRTYGTSFTYCMIRPMAR